MKPKIVGLLTAWGCDQWIGAALKQALCYCDDVVVSVGAHHPSLQKYEDYTQEIVKSFPVRTVPTQNEGDHVLTKGRTLQKMLESSEHYKAGNWVWILDADEFYFDADVELCRQAINTGKYNSIELPEKFFYINFRHYLTNSRRRLKKIVSDDTRFGQTNRFGQEDPVAVIDTDKGIYHYSLLLNPNLKRDFWAIERKNSPQNNKIDWLDNTYLKYDLSQPTKNPQGPHCFQPNENGYLHRYDGVHPHWVETKGFRSVPDFRTLFPSQGV